MLEQRSGSRAFQEDQTAGVVVFPKIKEIQVLEDYKLRLKYVDGAEGIFDFEKLVGFTGVFEKLRDPALFRKARISRDGWRTLNWPGQLDLDPVQVYSDVTGKSVEWILDQDDPPKPSRKRKIKAGARIGKSL